LWQEVTCLPRLTERLDELELFTAACREGREGPAALCAPTYTHPFLTAGFLANEPWLQTMSLVVVPDAEAAGTVRHELAAFLQNRTVLSLPPRGIWYGSEAEPNPAVVASRARVAASLHAPHQPHVVVASAAALMEGILAEFPAPESVVTGARLDVETFLEKLVILGYERVNQVEEAGEIALRGGLVDVFPAGDSHPVRIELWGDEVESIRTFSVYSQRSLNTLKDLVVLAAREVEKGEIVPFHTLLPPEARVVTINPRAVENAAREFADDLEDVFGGVREDGEEAGRAGGEYSSWTEVQLALSSHHVLEVRGQGEGATCLEATSGDLPVASRAEAEQELARLVDKGYRVVVAFDRRSDAERAEYVLKQVRGAIASPDDIPVSPGVSYLPAAHRRHLILPEIRLALLTSNQVFPRRRKERRASSIGREISSFRDLRKDDFVVHEDHGIGRFLGISTRTVAGITRDYLDLAFRGEDRLYVPHEQIGKVSRYVGSNDSGPSLSKLGGSAWDQAKARARTAVRELASELLQLYALRETAEGFAYPLDGEWQRQFEDSFSFRETEDQIRAIDAVKDDMESGRPMDRLICGDVGYGKTEVALRAAFKAVMGGRQVIVLVPTTILAQQHYATFQERLAEFPVKIGLISRFRSVKEQKKMLAGFQKGDVDILVGTHRLLSGDIRPKNLGMVIVDEEQRFGVVQKEALRQLKLQCDVLALSATPIPRTLHISLAGVRDISVIETPPQGRHPIQTYAGVFDENMVQRAVRRELARGGQVYYLHNRVETIELAASRVRDLVPEARVVVAHGQMRERTLEDTMLGFLRQEYDILVSTTIIESGLDIPNANTLIVDRADLLGLAQLYQLRGRIGRSARVAHAFLFHPPEEVLTKEAFARLSTLSDYTELGSGFKIAMRDLEIRGAGNLLGDEQSGHVAAVGFDLYLGMLRRTVEAMQDREQRPPVIPRVDIGISAYIPAEFIGFEAARVDIHRRIAEADNEDGLRELREELRDRFGSLPEPVDNLIFLGEVRLTLQKLCATGLSLRGHKVRISGLELPSGSREALRGRDRRYAYSPVTGELGRSQRGDGLEAREMVEGVLNDIMQIRFSEAGKHE